MPSLRAMSAATALSGRSLGKPHSIASSAVGLNCSSRSTTFSRYSLYAAPPSGSFSSFRIIATLQFEFSFSVEMSPISSSCDNLAALIRSKSSKQMSKSCANIGAIVSRARLTPLSQGAASAPGVFLRSHVSFETAICRQRSLSTLSVRRFPMASVGRALATIAALTSLTDDKPKSDTYEYVGGQMLPCSASVIAFHANVLPTPQVPFIANTWQRFSRKNLSVTARKVAMLMAQSKPGLVLSSFLSGHPSRLSGLQGLFRLVASCLQLRFELLNGLVNGVSRGQLRCQHVRGTVLA